MEDGFSHYASSDGVRRGQHLLPAFFGGLIAAISGAFAWMYVPSSSGLDVGYVALGMGLWVGAVVRFSGSGSSLIFGLVGVGMTLFGSGLAEILGEIEAHTDAHSDFLNAYNHLHLFPFITSLVTNATPLVYGLYALSIVVSFFLSMRK
jgi:ABC-type uncharacterized transport system permease subunit